MGVHLCIIGTHFSIIIHKLIIKYHWAMLISLFDTLYCHKHADEVYVCGFQQNFNDITAVDKGKPDIKIEALN